MSMHLGVLGIDGKIRDVSDNNGYPTQLSGSNAADAQSGLIPGMGYNGATYDRWRNNTQGTLLASAARTAAVATPDQINYNARGVVITLNITASSGTGGLIVTIRGRDPVSGNPFTLNVAPTAVTAVATTSYVVYPGASAGGVTQATPVALPRTWYVVVSTGDATSYTYSVGYTLIL